MKGWRLLAAGLAVYAVAVIATAPATMVDAILRDASAGRMRLAEARGTLWAGTGQIELLDAGRKTGIARHLGWHFQPAWLLRGRLVCAVELGTGAQRFAVMIFPNRIELAAAEISLPATILGVAVPELAPLGLGGDLRVHVTGLVIRRGRLQANATVQWRAASSAHAPVSPLGDYELRFENSGTAVKADLRTLEGPLQLDGSGSWANSASPAFKATAHVLPPHRERLEPFLRMIAIERGAGNFELQLK